MICKYFFPHFIGCLSTLSIMPFDEHVFNFDVVPISGENTTTSMIYTNKNWWVEIKVLTWTMNGMNVSTWDYSDDPIPQMLGNVEPWES